MMGDIVAPKRWIETSPFRRLSPILDCFVDMVEPALARVTRASRWIVVERADGDFDFHRARLGHSDFVGNGAGMEDAQRWLLSARRTDDVELRLLSGSVFSTTLKLPAAGLDHVDQIIAHRLDRLTPWKPESLIYGYACAARPGTDGQVDVAFAATSRDIAESCIRRLQSFGLDPTRMGSAAEPVGSELKIDLFRGARDRNRTIRRRWTTIVATALPALGTMAFMATAYLAFEADRRLAVLDQRLAAARATLIAGAGSPGDRQDSLAIIESKSALTPSFALIDQLARIIPDTTVLEELDIAKTSIRLGGSSTEASALIEILEAEPNLADAAFAAPVTRQSDQRDRFDIIVARVQSPAGTSP